MSKALNLLKNKQTVADRATEYLTSIEREVKRTFIEDLEAKIEGIEDRISEAKQFHLETNHNRGTVASTREECKDKFLIILELEYTLKMAKTELREKKAIFDEYFGAEEKGGKI